MGVVHTKSRKSLNTSARAHFCVCACLHTEIEMGGTYLVETSASALAPSSAEAAPATTTNRPWPAWADADGHADVGALTFCSPNICKSKVLLNRRQTPTHTHADAHTPTTCRYVGGDFSFEIMPFQFHCFVRNTCGLGRCCCRPLAVVDNGIGDAAQPAQRCGHFHRQDLACVQAHRRHTFVAHCRMHAVNKYF